MRKIMHHFIENSLPSYVSVYHIFLLDYKEVNKEYKKMVPVSRPLNNNKNRTKKTGKKDHLSRRLCNIHGLLSSKKSTHPELVPVKTQMVWIINSRPLPSLRPTLTRWPQIWGNCKRRLIKNEKYNSTTIYKLDHYN